MSFNDDLKYRGRFEEDEMYQVSWIPDEPQGNFGTLRVYYRNAVARDIAAIIKPKSLRPGKEKGALMKKGMWHVNRLDMKLKDDNSNLEEVIDQRIHGSFAPDAQLAPWEEKVKGRSYDVEIRDDETKAVDDTPHCWDAAWRDVKVAQIETALYWFTGYYSTSGAIVYESWELAQHAAKMLKKNIAGVIVVLTPMEGRVPNDDGDKE